MPVPTHPLFFLRNIWTAPNVRLKLTKLYFVLTDFFAFYLNFEGLNQDRNPVKLAITNIGPVQIPSPRKKFREIIDKKAQQISKTLNISMVFLGNNLSIRSSSSIFVSFSSFILYIWISFRNVLNENVEYLRVTIFQKAIYYDF